DTAIARFDTLNSFPKVLQALGVSAEESERAMQRLGDGIDGLPTTLNDIAQNAQNMYSAFGDMDKATDMALALNNALLGSGSSAVEAQRGVDMYMKILNTGKVDMMTWNSLNNTMGVGLEKLAEEFEFTGASAKNDLYKALQDGVIPMETFHDKLIEIGTGTGIMATLAKENSKGIATSIGNLKNSAARGIANIIGSFDKLSENVTKKDIAEHIDSLKHIVNASFKVIGTTIERTAPVIKNFAAGIKAIIPIVKTLSPALIGLATAFLFHSTVLKVTAAVKGSTIAMTAYSTIVKLLSTYQNIATATTHRHALAVMLMSAQTKIAGITQAAYVATIALAAKVQAAFTLGMTASTIAAGILKVATIALSTAIQIMTGPIGWVTLAIGLLAGAIVGIVKWFKRGTEEGKKMAKETEELANSANALNDSVKGTTDAYKANQREMKATAERNSDLAKKIEELAKKENKSAGEKALLQSHIESLNGSIDDLNLSYDEEANALNMSSKELSARVDLMKEQERGIAAQERLKEVMQEQNEIQMELKEINELQDEWNKKVEEKAVKASEAKEEIAKLDEQENALKETLSGLTVQQQETEDQIITSTENITAAIESGNLRQITSYEDLEDHHKAVFDSMKATYDELKEAATDAFDKIDTKTDHTMKSMTENLLHNQEVVAAWGENQAKLMQWAGEKGYDNFIPYIESMGIDSAAELAVLAKAGDTELKKFADAIEKGAEVAGDGFKTSLGSEFDQAIDVMINFVDDGSQTLKQQIEKSKFDEIGKMVPEGLIKGVEDGTPKVEKATQSMAEKATKSAEEELGVKSPSRVFKEIGTNVTDGMILGVSNGTTKVIQAMQKMAKSSVDPFKDTPSQFNSIGKNAMAGLNRGLLAGRAQVMSTARSIANSVASTMRNALQIHSPSRVMMEIGEFTGEGFVVGFESMTAAAKNASESMSDAMLGAASPRVKSSEKTKRNAEKIMGIFYKIVEVQI
ncbi:tape measure protein, partial [Pseudogracilibacillus auburnensis]|uniref:tape measure protein n=1 Tax=Pseudogracilibacillus auburnensis TaxID=1494959 RepID=UPI001A9736B4